MTTDKDMDRDDWRAQRPDEDGMQAQQTDMDMNKDTERSSMVGGGHQHR